MSRTLNQQMGDLHESDIARWIGGRQTKGSGNQWSDQMDAKNGLHKVPFPVAGDGKATLGKSVGVSREMWNKAQEQSFGEIPALFLRWYRDQTLRTVDQDLVVLAVDDFVRILEAARKWAEKEAQEEALLEDMADALAAMEGEPVTLVHHFPSEVSCGVCKRPLPESTGEWVSE